jgi:hypothetical protein
MIFRLVPILEVSTGMVSRSFKLSRDLTSIAGGVIAAGAIVWNDTQRERRVEIYSGSTPML